MLNAAATGWVESGKPQLKAGHRLNDSEILFTKIEDKIIDELASKYSAQEVAGRIPSEEITIDDFKRVNLNVVKIISAENVKKSDKLMKLQVDLGNEKRQVIAGIAKSYKPETLIGKNVLLVTNLKPVKLFGLESQGMILATDIPDSDNVRIIEIDDSILPGTPAK
jgi:methionyl-tRNA synthetase